MTRDQLFALPVGTRLDIGHNQTFTIVSTGNGSVTFQFTVTPDTLDVADLAEMLQVIPGELDASEVVE